MLQHSYPKKKLLINMAAGNSELVKDCFEYEVGGYIYTILLCAMPFQVLLIKVLIKDLGLRMPRHTIMLSMSISDVIHPISVCIFYIIMSAFDSRPETSLCHALRQSTLFLGILTTVVSSLGVIAMSIERYVACIHSFHIHRIFTQERVVYGSIIQWVIGTILAITEVLTNNVSGTNAIKTFSALHIIFITFTYATAIPVGVIQARLFFFAKTKLKQINPAGAFGPQLELADYRKKHFKVALVSGIVAFGFVVSMLPTASLFLYEVSTGSKASKLATDVCFSFTKASCLVNPFIYGIGNADARKMIVQNLKKAKQFIIFKLCPSKVESGAFTVARNL